MSTPAVQVVVGLPLTIIALALLEEMTHLMKALLCTF